MGQMFPYSWEAHHLLPGSAFYYENESGPAFTPQQYEILLSSPYNINHGHNIIMLPKQAPAVPVHKLIQPPSDHPEYTQLVIKDLQTLQKTIQKLIDKQEDHTAIKASLVDELKGLEEKYWKYVVGIGRKSVKAVSEGTALEGYSVRYEAKSGRVYQWGALY